MRKVSMNLLIRLSIDQLAIWPTGHFIICLKSLELIEVRCVTIFTAGFFPISAKSRIYFPHFSQKDSFTGLFLKKCPSGTQHI